MAGQKIPRAINTYEQGIRAAMLLSRAHKMETLAPEG